MKQMKRNRMGNRMVALLLAVTLMASLLLSMASVASAAEDKNVIHITSAKDFSELAKNCTLDTWSLGKTVVLQADISLLDAEIQTIPTFSGTFDGNGHTIRDLSITQSVAPAGLFGILQKDAVVKDLTVIGNVAPSGDADTLGGIAGINYGKLTGSMFHGFVSGNNRVGGLVGLNETTGQLINCTFQGALTGEHYAGGIAGWNAGSLIQCTNSGSINTTVIDVKTELSDLNMEQLRSTESVPAGTDIGGIAGFSTGLLQSCKNTGDVGYEHMGYNVGGIVGRQSGYLDGCVNKGTILGRKDVGGIAGQLEPQVTLRYNEDTLDSLWDELDILEDLLDRTLSDAEGASDAISDSMGDLTDSVGTAKDSTVDMTDAMTEWANGNIDQVNDISARFSWVLSQMEPILDDLGEALEQAETAAGQFSDALDDAELAAKWGNEAVASMETALTDLQNAFAHGRDVYTHVKTAMTYLENSLGNTSQTKIALKELIDATSDMASAFSGIANAMSGIGSALDKVYTDIQTDTNWQNLRTGTDELRLALTDISKALTQVSSALETIRNEFNKKDESDPEYKTNKELLKEAMDSLATATEHLSDAYTDFSEALEAYEGNYPSTAVDKISKGMDELEQANESMGTAIKDMKIIIDRMDTPEMKAALEQLADGLARLNTGLGDANDAIVKIDAALKAIENDQRYKDTVTNIRNYLKAVNTGLGTLSGAASRLGNALKVLNSNLNLDQAEKAWGEIKSAGDDLELAAADLDKAVSSMKLALEAIKKAGEYGTDAMSDLNKASETMGEAVSLLRRSSDKVADVIGELAEKPVIQFTPVNSELTERGDALDDALSQVLDQVNSLNDTMSSSSDILLADMRAINRQVGVIIDQMRQASEESEQESTSDRYEDVSDQELPDDQVSGRISSTSNSGKVEGDINVAGIVGSVAIEYDYDPEDDLTKEGSRSLDFRYQTAAVVLDNVNKGMVTAKKDYAGGIAGRMDLGTIHTCQNYGSVESTAGDYVGGVAGLTGGTIRNSFVKCTLEGGSYVGGIVGSGTDATSGGADSIVSGCYSMVDIPDAGQYFGAISGEDTGTFQDNVFVSDTLAGINGISYSGRAEPAAYADLPWDDEDIAIPEGFQKLTLQFVVDDETVKTVSFKYGDSFDDSVYPEIPKKDGNYSKWDQEELKDLHFDTVVTAVYTPYITALTDAESRTDGRPVFFVQGKFDDVQSPDVTALTDKPENFSFLASDPVDFLRKSFSGWTVSRSVVEQWKISVPDDGQKTHTIRYLPPDADLEHVDIYVNGENGWKKAKTEIIGSYLVFSVTGLETEIAVISTMDVWWVWLLAGAFLVLLLIVSVRRLRKKMKEKNR